MMGKWMMPRLNKTLYALAALLLAAASLPAWSQPSYAAVPKLDTIRVALYLDFTPLRSAATITLSANNGMTIAVHDQAGDKPWIDVDAGQTVRASVDSFMVQAAETNDFSAAQTLAKKLKDASYTSYIFARSKSEKTVYQVTAGMFASQETASTAMAAIKQTATLASGMTPVLTGPLHWNAGTYDSVLKAKQQVDALAKAGLSAELAYVPKADGAAEYAVFLGSEPDQAALDALKATALKAQPQLALQPVEAASAYLLQREDMSSAAGPASASAVHYALNANGPKLRWTPKATTDPKGMSRISVAEKKRSYRGSIELSGYNGKLAVINELPFEQYLYSVVTSEVIDSWPAEALKAQAVAARTYALYNGRTMDYADLAHVSDTTYDQAYNKDELPNSIKAVDDTAGQVLVDKAGNVINALFSSNAGGIAADSIEVWGNPVSYLRPVASPDESVTKGKLDWYRIVLPSGVDGYMRSDLLGSTGQSNAAGLPIYSVSEDDAKVRVIPRAADWIALPITALNAGDKVTVIGKVPESTEYSWIAPVIDGAKLAEQLQPNVAVPLNGVVRSLAATKRGPSGRVTELKANGQPIDVGKSPDNFRKLLFGLQSTMFAIEETGRYTIVGANGSQRTVPDAPGPLQAAGAAGSKPLTNAAFYVMNADNQVRVATKDPKYVVTGKGNGHGLGLSQWGAKGFADQGYDYRRILKTYYTDQVSITKG